MKTFSIWINEAKKSKREPTPPTITSSPTRGQNQDYTGTGVKHDTADYTISDEKINEISAQLVGKVNKARIVGGKPSKTSAAVKTLANAVRKKQIAKPVKEETIDEVVVNKPMSPKDKKALQAYTAKHRAKLASHDTGIEPEKKSFKHYSGQMGDHKHEPSKMGLRHAIGAGYYKHEEVEVSEMIAGVSGERQTPSNMSKTSNTGTSDAPKSASSLQTASDKRRIQLDKLGQKQKEQQEKDRESQQKSRERAQSIRDKVSKIQAKASKTNSSMKEEVIAEGRPKKNATAEDPGSDNIINQLRKVITLRGQEPVKFVNGQKIKLTPAIAHRLLTMYDNMRTTGEKHAFSMRIHKSPDDLRDTMMGKKEVAKPKVSLAGKITGTKT